MERIVLHDAIFREANDRIGAAADDYTDDGEKVPFVCECADSNCRELIRMPVSAYRMIRSDPTLFLNVAGHQASEHGHAVMVAQHDGHIVVEKVGAAGRLAAELEGDELLSPRGDRS